jgi:hypothetical protein
MSGKFAVHIFIRMTKSWSQIPTLLQGKMAEQGKQMRVWCWQKFFISSSKNGSTAFR